jgi:hypothetical protein
MQYYTFSSSIVGTPLSAVQSSSNLPRQDIKEGYTDQEVIDLYNTMLNDPKYNMKDDNAIRYPPTHPNYSPNAKDVMTDNTNQVLQQQYTTLAMTMVATISLGIVAYMVSG